jgi:autotransporter-associated beta strand protein
VIDVNSGTTLTYNGIIANNTGGTGGLVKTSFGTLSLGAANTYSGATQLKNGNITLNFAATSAPVTDIINPASNLVIGGATSGLGQQSNATLLLTGKANTANSQSFASTHVDLYGSVIQATKGTGTGTSTLNLGAITRTLGGTLVFGTNGTAADGTTVVTNQGVIKTTTTVGANGILGGWADRRRAVNAWQPRHHRGD